MTLFVNEAEAMAAVDGFTSSWLARDIDRMATFVAHDFVLWNNCHKAELQGPAAIRFFNWLTTMVWNNSFYDVQRHLTPFGVVQQHHMSFETAQGAFQDIPMMLVFTMRSGLVARCEAYLDSTGLPRFEWPEAA